MQRQSMVEKTDNLQVDVTSFEEVCDRFRQNAEFTGVEEISLSAST